VGFGDRMKKKDAQQENGVFLTDRGMLGGI